MVEDKEGVVVVPDPDVVVIRVKRGVAVVVEVVDGVARLVSTMQQSEPCSAVGCHSSQLLSPQTKPASQWESRSQSPCLSEQGDRSVQKLQSASDPMPWGGRVTRVVAVVVVILVAIMVAVAVVEDLVVAVDIASAPALEQVRAEL